jgi:HPt (histidine-containing phosphotransfer) domain-containing protein
LEENRLKIRPEWAKKAVEYLKMLESELEFVKAAALSEDYMTVKAEAYRLRGISGSLRLKQITGLIFELEGISFYDDMDKIVAIIEEIGGLVVEEREHLGDVLAGKTD